MTRAPRLPILLALAALVLVAAPGCAAPGSEEDAILRGDQAFARGDYPSALAEYRLALRQGSEDVSTYLRAAHAFARVGRIDEARDHYREAIRRDGTVADLASADLLRVARAARDRRDGTAAAMAVEAAIELQPGVSLAGLALPLAQHFSRNAQYGQALPYFQKALIESDQDPEILLELARTHEHLGDCERALVFFEQVRPEIPANRRSEVDWHVGNCSFELAAEAQGRGFSDDALRYFRTTIDLGEPRNRLAQAWFQVGEIQAQRGECEVAVQSFERVLRDEMGGGGFLAQRARNRIDEIRFRRGGDGPC